MFGNSQNMRTKTEDAKETCCYGGFERRFLYEQCKGVGSSHRISAARFVSVFCVCIIVGVFGMLCGIVMYHFAASGKPLDYSGGAAEVPFETPTSTAAATVQSTHRTALLSDSSTEDNFVNVSSDAAERYRVPVGVMLKRVDADSAAYSAGFRAGDILVSIDGVQVRDVEGMNKIISMRDAFAKSKITVFRNNDYIVIEVAF